MTKARARTRAKERARAKAANPNKKADRPDAAQQAGYHDANANGRSKMNFGAQIKSAAGMRRNVSRSR